MDKRIEEIISRIEVIKETKGRIDIVEIANQLGIRVYSTKEIKQSSFIAYDSETENYEIYLNAKEKGTRQRFSVAHEIAHYLLHKDKIISFGVVGRECNASLSLVEEKDADNLAAKLLMPDNSVIKFLNKKNISMNIKLNKNIVIDIASEFEVSIIAAALRLRELGYYVGYIEM